MGLIHQKMVRPRTLARSSGVSSWYSGNKTESLSWHSKITRASSRNTWTIRKYSTSLLCFRGKINSSDAWPSTQASIYNTSRVDGVADRRCSTKERTQKPRAETEETISEKIWISNACLDAREYLTRLLSCNARKANAVTCIQHHSTSVCSWSWDIPLWRGYCHWASSWYHRYETARDG